MLCFARTPLFCRVPFWLLKCRGAVIRLPLSSFFSKTISHCRLTQPYLRKSRLERRLKEIAPTPVIPNPVKSLRHHFYEGSQTVRWENRFHHSARPLRNRHPGSSSSRRANHCSNRCNIRCKNGWSKHYFPRVHRTSCNVIRCGPKDTKGEVRGLSHYRLA